MCGSGRALLLLCNMGVRLDALDLTCGCSLHSCEIQSGSSLENEASPTLMYNVVWD